MKKNVVPWTITELSRQVHRLTFHGCRSNSVFEALIQSDEHWDNAHCDRRLLTKHHQEAVARRAPIFKFGDTFCAMQGKWDKRADNTQLRPEHRGGNYLNQLVNTAADYYEPYADNIVLITPGNHEGSILQRHQFDLIQALHARLAARSKVPHIGSYCGFVQFRFEFSGTFITKTLCYHHGYGGGGEVTRGFIDHNRTRGQYQADIYVSGHIHRRNSDENIMISCTPSGKIRRDQQLFLRSSTYKDEWDGGGYHVMNGRAGRPIGGWWLKFICHDTNGEKSVEIIETRAT